MSESRFGAVRRPVLCVLVVYERSLSEVAAWPLIEKLLRRTCQGTDIETGFALQHVLIYDNSPRPMARPDPSCPGASWIHDASNGGTATAYAAACRSATEAGIEWMLLLDHDSLLPPDFFEAASTAYERLQGRALALVPWVSAGGRVVSPARVTRTGSIAPLQSEACTPVATHDLTALASGSLLHVPTMSALLPLPDALWLDYVDHWIFRALRQRGAPIAVIDASLRHELSVADVASLSARRLISILDGEALFMSRLGSLAKFLYPVRLGARVVRYARVNPALAAQALRWMGARIMRRT